MIQRRDEYTEVPSPENRGKLRTGIGDIVEDGLGGFALEQHVGLTSCCKVAACPALMDSPTKDWLSLSFAKKKGNLGGTT
ncbi:hypothetical protein [Paenibacillus selenitireducens]|uniref:hypothetical protein n=1 Tax=Paenibacillus selenitireducens TaxID=1324314 RepID=UPI00117C5973|nr:hypothetical protein [Paenibacillus selenitireducens]